MYPILSFFPYTIVSTQFDTKPIMKKSLVIIVAMIVASVSANAQILDLIGKGLNAINKQQNSTQQDNNGSQDEMPTAEELMAQMPAMPNAQQIADYEMMVISGNANPFKLMLNPAAAFQTQLNMAIAGANGVAFTSSSDRLSSWADNMQRDRLAEVGVTPEQLEQMSEEEQEAVYQRIRDNTLRKMGINASLEQLENMSEEEMKAVLSNSNINPSAAYNSLVKNAFNYETATAKRYLALMEQYNSIDSIIYGMYNKTLEECENLWNSKYAAKGKAGLSDYLKEAATRQIATVQQAQNLRKTQQLAIASQIETAYKALRAEQPQADDVITVMSSKMTIMCASTYLSEGMKLFETYKPEL